MIAFRCDCGYVCGHVYTTGMHKYKFQPKLKCTNIISHFSLKYTSMSMHLYIKCISTKEIISFVLVPLSCKILILNKSVCLTYSLRHKDILKEAQEAQTMHTN